MKKNNVFVAHLARGAVASTLAACVVPQTKAEIAAGPVEAREVAFNSEVGMPDGGTQEATNASLVFRVRQGPSEWDKSLEREFRKLALQEAKGGLSEEQALRLEQLNRWRDRLLCPQLSQEILLQIKRDRILARMQEVLKDYVEFQEAAGKKRTAA